jgi:hypothetical protein
MKTLIEDFFLNLRRSFRRNFNQRYMSRCLKDYLKIKMGFVSKNFSLSWKKIDIIHLLITLKSAHSFVGLSEGCPRTEKQEFVFNWLTVSLYSKLKQYTIHDIFSTHSYMYEELCKDMKKIVQNVLLRQLRIIELWRNWVSILKTIIALLIVLRQFRNS